MHIRRRNIVGDCADYLRNDVILQHVLHEDCKIICRSIVLIIMTAVNGCEMGIDHSELNGFCVHELDEFIYRFGFRNGIAVELCHDFNGKSLCGIVAAAHHKTVENVTDRDNLAADKAH